MLDTFSIPVVSADGSTIPPHSVVAVVDSRTSGSASQRYNYLTVQVPSGDLEEHEVYLVTGELEITGEIPGHAYLPYLLPVLVSYTGSSSSSGGEIAIGDVLGVESGSFSLTPDTPFANWKVLKVNESLELVTAIQIIGPRILKCKTIGEHAIGDTQPCVVLYGQKGEEIESDVEINCFNSFATLQGDTTVIAAFVVNGWELIAATCSEESS